MPLDGLLDLYLFFILDLCNPNPCQNGGTCSIRGTVYDCHCPSMFVGDLCQNKGQLFVCSNLKYHIYYKAKFSATNNNLHRLSTVIEGGWGAWGSWESCSVDCGGGHRRRTRKCNSPTPVEGGSHCSADGSSSSKTEPCNQSPCKGNEKLNLFEISISH